MTAKYLQKPFFNLVNHPLTSDRLTLLRHRETGQAPFREALQSLTQFLFYESMRNFPTQYREIPTPVGEYKGRTIDPKMVFVSIMRSGNLMVDALQKILPHVPAGHIGIYRDKNIESTVEYFFRLPEKVENKHIFLSDPMMATGDTTTSAINRLKDYSPSSITFLTLMCSPEGLKKTFQNHSDIRIFSLALEKGVDGEGRLTPGLGDASKRIYGTA